MSTSVFLDLLIPQGALDAARAALRGSAMLGCLVWSQPSISSQNWSLPCDSTLVLDLCKLRSLS